MSAKRWFIVTNTENLEFFLNCGLVVDKQGFSKNAYVSDIMCKRPAGYLPCLHQDNLWGALQAAKSEDENLTECMLELDVKQINAQAFCRTDEMEIGTYRSLNIKSEIDLDSQVLSEMLLPAPLPMSCIKKIILKDASTKKSITAKYDNAYGTNDRHLVTSEAKLFKEPKQAESNLALESGDNSDEPKPVGEQLPPRELSYDKAFSYGGALSLLYYQTKNGRQSTQIFKDFSDENADPEKLENIAPLLAVFFKQANECDETAQLYSQVINCIYNQGNVDEARYDVLQLLKDQEELPETYANECTILASRLTLLIERTHPDDSDTIFEKLIKYYEDREKGRSKIFLLLTMFFVRDHSETMLKYYHSAFKEEDYCLLALFFGAVNGFISTPSVVRGVHGLSTWISFKMAEYMHRQEQSGCMNFSEPSSPFLIYDKCFKSKNINYYESYKFYRWFSHYMDVSVNDFLDWKLEFNSEAVLKGKHFESESEPKLTAKITFELLEGLITAKTIKNADELFDFNPVIDAYKKKS